MSLFVLPTEAASRVLLRHGRRRPTIHEFFPAPRKKLVDPRPRDPMGGNEDGIAAIGGARPDGHALAMEGFGHTPPSALEADIVLGERHRAHDLVGVVLDRGHAVGHGARAWPIAARRDLLSEGLMRALEIVDGAP